MGCYVQPFLFMEYGLKLEIIDYLKGFIKEGRWETINEVLDKRTEHVTVVLENIYQPHNASAVLRSCDGFGIKDVHVIENTCEFDPHIQITLGADQWLDINRYNTPDNNNTITCLESLKAKGYQIIATTPHEKESNLNDLDITKPTALVFGNELDGFSQTVLEHADGFVKIPMYGFTESFNISVSAAICMYDLTTRMKKENSNIDWRLSEEKRNELLLTWLKSSIKAGEQLADKYLREREIT